jgi:hypothetical protein
MIIEELKAGIFTLDGGTLYDADEDVFVTIDNGMFGGDNYKNPLDKAIDEQKKDEKNKKWMIEKGPQELSKLIKERDFLDNVINRLNDDLVENGVKYNHNYDTSLKMFSLYQPYLNAAKHLGYESTGKDAMGRATANAYEQYIRSDPRFFYKPIMGPPLKMLNPSQQILNYPNRQQLNYPRQQQTSPGEELEIEGKEQRKNKNRPYGKLLNSLSREEMGQVERDTLQTIENLKNSKNAIENEIMDKQNLLNEVEEIFEENAEPIIKTKSKGLLGKISGYIDEKQKITDLKKLQKSHYQISDKDIQTLKLKGIKGRELVQGQRVDMFGKDKKKNLTPYTATPIIYKDMKTLKDRRGIDPNLIMSEEDIQKLGLKTQRTMGIVGQRTDMYGQPLYFRNNPYTTPKGFEQFKNEPPITTLEQLANKNI